MNMKKEYPNIRIPMYIVTRLLSNNLLIESEYKTLAEVQEMINERLELFNSLPKKEGDDYVTQCLTLRNGELFIITTTYLQTTVTNE